jgi:hypothetical protein
MPNGESFVPNGSEGVEVAEVDVVERLRANGLLGEEESLTVQEASIVMGEAMRLCTENASLTLERALNVAYLDRLLHVNDLIDRGEKLSVDQCETLIVEALLLCGEDASLNMEDAISLVYIDSLGGELLAHLSPDKLRVRLEEVTHEKWSQEEIGQILPLIKDSGRRKKGALINAIQVHAKRHVSNAQAVVNDRGEILGIGPNPDKLLRDASKQSGRIDI